MSARLAVLTAAAVTVVLGVLGVLGVLAPRATADWTPITPTPAGCADYGWTATRTNPTTVKVVNRLIADWQIGAFVVNGTTYHWTIVKQVVDKPYCHGFRATLTAKTTRNQLHYFWCAADGSWLEDGWKAVRR